MMFLLEKMGKKRVGLAALLLMFFYGPLLAEAFDRGSAPQYDFSGSQGYAPPPTAREFAPPSPTSPVEEIEESEVKQEDSETFGVSSESPPQAENFLHKKPVEIPPTPPRTSVEAGDIRDPFSLIRGHRTETTEALDPGETIDGIRFNTYADTPELVEKFYKDSNFSIKDVFGQIIGDNRDEGCQFCHHGIEEISTSHKLECTGCHGGNSGTRNKKRAHKSMASNPSAPQHAAQYCGKCHAKQVSWMEQSLMNSGRGILDLTRHALGAPEKSVPQKEASAPEAPVVEETQTQETEAPDVPEKVEGAHAILKPGSLEQEFLDKKCLRCHLSSEAPRRPGDFRATGCAACHMVYSNDGGTLTRDRAVQRANLVREEMTKQFQRDHAANSIDRKRGYPVIHQFTVAVPSVQCEHCHHSNGVGGEFEGLFQIPARPRDSGKKVRDQQPVLYGAEHELLVPDIHRERGMHCIDCHSGNEMKADPSGFRSMHDAVKIRCEDCHGTASAEPEFRKLDPANFKDQTLIKKARLNPNIKRKIKKNSTVLVTSSGLDLLHVQKGKNDWVLISKVTGKRHRIPQVKELKKPPVAHRVGAHLEKVECHACHARWSANDWGLHAIREPEAGADFWKDWMFTDPVWNYLESLRETQPNADRSQSLLWPTVTGDRDGLSGVWSPGVWVTLFARSDWSRMILGKNARGKVTVLKPRHQYFLTDRTAVNETGLPQTRVPATRKGQPALVLTPHTPHTIRPRARACEACHGNREAIGLGAAQLQQVQDAKSFSSQWKASGQLPDEFQLGQTLTKSGAPLQSVVPGGARVLNRAEANRLLKETEAYRAARYLDLQEKNLGALLKRESFPYDRLHELNQEKYGSPTRTEDMVYNKETQIFDQNSPEADAPIETVVEPELVDPASATEPSEESTESVQE